MKLNIEEIQCNLTTKFMCRNILYYESLDSTQDELKKILNWNKNYNSKFDENLYKIFDKKLNKSFEEKKDKCFDKEFNEIFEEKSNNKDIPNGTYLITDKQTARQGNSWKSLARFK